MKKILHLSFLLLTLCVGKRKHFIALSASVNAVDVFVCVEMRSHRELHCMRLGA